MKTLSDLLAAHPCADDQERRDRDRMLALLEAGPEAFSRAHFAPGHFTGSAFVVDAPGKRLLMLHHARLNRWLQPGGHAEPGESPLETALREATEESGIEGLAPHPRHPGILDLDVHRIPERKGEPAHDHHDVRFLLLAPPGAEPRVSAESHAVEWRPLGRAAAPDADPGLHRAIAKVRKLLA